MFKIVFISIFISLISFSARAEIDCENTSTTGGMYHCTMKIFEREDKKLNAAYKKAQGVLRDQGRSFQNSIWEDDKELGVILLRDAQRSWIKFRDQACEAEGFTHFPGNMAPLVGLSCKVRLTIQRTEDLLAIK
ncbi:DUF1311 domain-containing protein [Rhodobacteraceae bacterium RKSG542]|uniref:lysozyme inhibitor LprI family protein n=1 Tax=Pseudovibrio flavus TaxID=2529854 RepID=UPI0012BBD359|nr:lysozyme inhibitor LprI family protein [Pseudovibrio flavus]MTI17263.1 DUF1311 domain-containing protein [Pseudovibrio flavus]